MKEKVSGEVAGETIKKWLEFKGIRPTKRAAYEAYISELVQAVMYGEIVVNDNFTITQTLKTPVKDTTGAVVFDNLTFAARLNAQQIREAIKGIDTADDMGNAFAIGYALTGKAPALLGKMDSNDFGVVTAIGVFFT